MAPHPEAEDDKDPFSLGDSDDDDGRHKDVRVEDAERLKAAAAEAGKAEDKGSGDVLRPAERAGGNLGVRDKEADEVLKG